MSIAGGRGSTPFKGDDEGIFISRVTESGPADLAGLRVGDKVLKVNGVSVEFADHYEAVEILKACGAVLVLFISREVTKLVGHPVFGEDGVVAQITTDSRPVVTHVQPAQETVKQIPPPIQIVSQQQMAGVDHHYQQLNHGLQTPTTTSALLSPNLNGGGGVENGKLNDVVHKVTLHTTLIRDQMTQGLGFSIAGGKGSSPFKDGSDSIFISRITDGGLAHRDGKINIGDKILAVSHQS